MSSPEEMVREFHAGAKQLGGGWNSATLQTELFLEEAREFLAAVRANDLVEIADAIADITYVLIGTAIELGIPFDRVFAEVHRSNMTKLIPPVAIREDGKIIKGPHYEPPQIALILCSQSG